MHRIIKGFMAQGGDYTSSTNDPPTPGNGSGGESIYPEGKFKDENLKMTHKRGLLSMANLGPDTN